MYILILLVTTLHIDGVQTSVTNIPGFTSKQACEVVISESQQLATTSKAYDNTVETKVSAVCVYNQ